MHQRAHRLAGRPSYVHTLLGGGVRDAGDVEVCPRRVADEALDELGGDNGAGTAGASVLDVGDGRLDELVVLAVHRQAPQTLAGGGGRALEIRVQPVVVGEEAEADAAERGRDCAGERGHVDERGAAQAFRVHDAVGEHEAALGVGVQDLDRLAVHGVDHVAGLGGGAARHILGAGRHGRHVHGRPQAGDRLHGPEYRGGAGHVGLHLLDRAGRRLQRDAAGVEGDALADQAHGAAAARAPVAEHDELRGLHGAGCDGEVGAHLQPLRLGAFDDRALQAVVGRDLLRATGQHGGGHQVRRFVHQVAREVRRLREDARLLHAARGCGGAPRPGFHERDRVDGAAGPVGLPRMVPVEAVETEQDALGHGCGVGLRIDRPARRVLERPRDATGPQPAEAARQVRRPVADANEVQRLALPRADDQHALRSQAAPGEDGDLAAAPGDQAAGPLAGDGAAERAVRLGGGAGEATPVLRHRHNDGVGVLLRDAAAGDLQLHGCAPLRARRRYGAW